MKGEENTDTLLAKRSYPNPHPTELKAGQLQE